MANSSANKWIVNDDKKKVSDCRNKWIDEIDEIDNDDNKMKVNDYCNKRNNKITKQISSR